MKFVNPRNDVAFKKIFGNEQHKEVLISFLNAVLSLEGDKEIQAVELLNPYQAPKLAGLKYTLLDVRAVDKRGIHFIVEMQLENVAGLRKRFQYYATKSYSGQIKRGDDYPRLNQVIFIGILNFNEFSSEHWLSRHALLNRENYAHELQDLEFYFIELPKFSKTESELDSVLDQWVYFLKHADDLEVIPPSSAKALRTAYEIADQFGWNQDELEVYDYWGMKAQDERGALQLAKERLQAVEERLQLEQERVQSAEERVQSAEERVQSAEERLQLEQERVQAAEERLQSEQERVQAAEERGKQALQENMLKIARTLKQQGVALEVIMQSTGLTAEDIARL
jgi:predicted transposase/invertase (TIGR01784 family)